MNNSCMIISYFQLHHGFSCTETAVEVAEGGNFRLGCVALIVASQGDTVFCFFLRGFLKPHLDGNAFNDTFLEFYEAPWKPAFEW